MCMCIAFVQSTSDAVYVLCVQLLIAYLLNTLFCLVPYCLMFARRTIILPHFGTPFNCVISQGAEEEFWENLRKRN